MNPAEAVQTHLDLGPSESIAMHFGTFQMTAEGIDEPVRALEDVRRARSVPGVGVSDLGFRRIVVMLPSAYGQNVIIVNDG